MKRNVCEECGGKVIHKQVDYILLGEKLGKFPAEICTKCGEQVFDEKVSEKGLSENLNEKLITQ